MGEVSNKINKIMDNIYNNASPSDATALEEEFAKRLKGYFPESYKKAANDLIDPENEIPSPGSIAHYIEELSEADQAKALAFINDWADQSFVNS